MGVCLPLLSVNLNASVAAISAVAVVLVDANVLFSSHAAGAAALFFTDADIFACVTVVSTRRALGPSSVLDRYALVCLDLSGLCSCLLVLVC